MRNGRRGAATRRHDASAARARALSVAAALAVAVAAGCGGADERAEPLKENGLPPATSGEPRGGGAAGEGGPDAKAPAGADAEGSSGSGSEGPEASNGAGGDDAAVGEKLPQSPPKQERSGDVGPVLEIRDGRCSPRTIEVPARQSLTVRNRGRRSATFQISRIGTDVTVRKGSALQVLLPPGRHAFVCRAGERRTTGKVTVERPGG